MIKMRTIVEAYKTLKTEDPFTAMTLSGLRRLVNAGYIPSIKIGRRILLNYDCLIEYLKTPLMEIKQENVSGIIRKIQQ